MKQEIKDRIDELHAVGYSDVEILNELIDLLEYNGYRQLTGDLLDIMINQNDDEGGDLYVVKIWHEIDPGHDVAGPEAAEEVFEVMADSPDQAIEWVKDCWHGPIDRIEIVDINPESNIEEPPYYYKGE